MEEIGVKEDQKMFWSKKDKIDVVPVPSQSQVGPIGISVTGQPIKDDVPLKDLIVPVPQGQKYGAE